MTQLKKLSVKKPPSEIEVPENFPYKLPKGFHWNKSMYDDVKAYGLFIKDRQIYCAYKVGKHVDEDSGEEVDLFNFRSSSNFSIKILQHIMDEKIPMRLVEIENIYNKKITFDCRSDEFTTMLKFKALIEGKGNFSWKGSPTEYDRLKMKLMDDMGDGRMISVLGWQPEGFFAFNNCAVNSEIIDYDENGRFQYKDHDYYVPSANHIYRTNPYKFLNQRKVQYVDSDMTFKKWSEAMRKVHRQHSILTICFGIACLFSDYIYQKLKFFPMIFLYGAASTGKGNLVRCIQSLFGEPQDTMTITGTANTDKAKIRIFAQFNNMVVFLDEYNNTLKQEGIEMLKGLWDRHGYTRGNIDSNFGTDTVPISSGVMMTGNDYPMNNELVTRLIVIEMMKDTFTPEEKIQFEKLNDILLAGYSNIIKEFLVFRKEFERNFLKTFNASRKVLSELLWDIDLVSRMVDNVSVLFATYKTFSPHIKFSFNEEDLKQEIRSVMLKQNAKRDASGDIQKFWDCFVQGIKDHKIKYGEHFKIDGNDLVFFYRDIYAGYLQSYYTLFRGYGLGKSTLLDKLKKSIAYKKELPSVRIKDRNTSGYVFDTQKIEQSFLRDILVLCEQSLDMEAKRQLEVLKQEPNVF